MANGRRPIPPIRAYTAAVLGVFALFVISAGAGMMSWSIVVLGVALMILAASLVAVSAMRGGARAYVAGTAHVVSASKPPASSAYGRCELHLLIDAPGMATSAVTIRDPRVPVAKWPDAGTTLPIMVAVDDPRRVRVQWDDVPTHAEAAAADEYSGGYAEDYSTDYSDEYPEYVPTRDPLDLPPDPAPAEPESAPPAGRAEQPPAGEGERAPTRGAEQAAPSAAQQAAPSAAEQAAPSVTQQAPTSGGEQTFTSEARQAAPSEARAGTHGRG